MSLIIIILIIPECLGPNWSFSHAHLGLRAAFYPPMLWYEIGSQTFSRVSKELNLSASFRYNSEYRNGFSVICSAFVVRIRFFRHYSVIAEVCVRMRWNAYLCRCQLVVRGDAGSGAIGLYCLSPAGPWLHNGILQQSAPSQKSQFPLSFLKVESLTLILRQTVIRKGLDPSQILSVP
jgi:hypothetical protein